MTTRTRSANVPWPTKPVTLITGSIIHWDRAHYSRHSFYRVLVTCGHCGKIREIDATHTRTKQWVFTGLCYRCNLNHQITLVGSGDTHVAWKGGRTISGGYVHIDIRVLSNEERIIAIPMSNHGYKGVLRIMEHRLVKALELGRPLFTSEIVHHRNGIRIDNRPENLEITTGSNHRKLDVKYYNLWQDAMKHIAELESELLKYKNRAGG